MKATGFGRCDFDVAKALRTLHAANPQALMFSTDLPCTRAPRPFEAHDFITLADALVVDTEDLFSLNAARFFPV